MILSYVGFWLSGAVTIMAVDQYLNPRFGNWKTSAMIAILCLTLAILATLQR